jgi:hypothetical protein
MSGQNRVLKVIWKWVAKRNGALTLPELFALRERLHRLKSEALDEFASADLAGKNLLPGFLLQVNGVRDYVTHQIQHREESEAKAPLSSSSVV